jgi:biopolymer transport protein ExbD
MKFPRNARIFRGQLDAAPFAVVFFLLVIFIMLASLVYTPGVRLDLPVSEGLPGTDKPTVAVAIDSSGRWYFENERVEEKHLRARLSALVKESPEPPTLIVQADKAATTEMVVRLTMLARGVGITNGLLATLPRPLSAQP